MTSSLATRFDRVTNPLQTSRDNDELVGVVKKRDRKEVKMLEKKLSNMMLEIKVATLSCFPRRRRPRSGFFSYENLVPKRTPGRDLQRLPRVSGSVCREIYSGKKKGKKKSKIRVSRWVEATSTTSQVFSIAIACGLIIRVGSSIVVAKPGCVAVADEAVWEA